MADIDRLYPFGTVFEDCPVCSGFLKELRHEKCIIVLQGEIVVGVDLQTETTGIQHNNSEARTPNPNSGIHFHWYNKRYTAAPERFEVGGTYSIPLHADGFRGCRDGSCERGSR